MKDKTKDRKNALIIALVAVILFMSLGYAAFASSLNINGTAKTTGSWDVEFTNLSETLSSGAVAKTAAAYTATTVTFDVELHAPGDYATYTATIENNGTIDAKLTSIIAPNLDGTDPIIYSLSGLAVNDVLEAGDSTTVTIRIDYDSSITQPLEQAFNKALSVTLNFSQVV